MGLFNYLAREMMRQQAYKRRQRRHSAWGFGAPPRSRSRYYSTWGNPRGGYYPARRHSRSNVRVVGCCLPIPLGIMGLGLALRSFAERTR